MEKNYRCPGCGVTMEFDPATQKLHCGFCESYYTVEEIERSLTHVNPYAETRETMQMTILHCNACGAELAIDGTEASTFCAFCGQAAVVTARLDGVLKPDYIIPFKVTKEEAEKTIRKRLSKGFFIPKKVKNFETETFRGIYIPFWLFDVYYGDRQLWRYNTGKSTWWGEKETMTAVRGGDCTFRNMTLDASQSVPDESSQRLEPYDTEEMVPFDAGFFASVPMPNPDEVAAELEKENIFLKKFHQ